MGTGFSVAFSFWAFAMTVVIGMYFLPTIVAVVARRRNAVLVAIVNTLLGWSVVGWVVALVMAATKEPEPRVVLINQAPPYAPITYEDATYRNVPGSSIQPR
jgi:hypothetical protein